MVSYKICYHLFDMIVRGEANLLVRSRCLSQLVCLVRTGCWGIKVGKSCDMKPETEVHHEKDKTFAWHRVWPLSSLVAVSASVS